jgi:hypothetical protein
MEALVGGRACAIYTPVSVFTLTIKFRVWNPDQQITDNPDRFQVFVSPKKKFGGPINLQF